MLAVIDLPGNLLGLLSVAAGDGEFVLALFAVPDGDLIAGRNRDADFAGVLGDFVGGHGGYSSTVPVLFTASVVGFAEAGLAIS